MNFLGPAALAYCDAFLTERPLRTKIEQKQIALDQRFRCTVCAIVAKAVDCGETLGPGR